MYCVCLRTKPKKYTHKNTGRWEVVITRCAGGHGLSIILCIPHAADDNAPKVYAFSGILFKSIKNTLICRHRSTRSTYLCALAYIRASSIIAVIMCNISYYHNIICSAPGRIAVIWRRSYVTLLNLQFCGLALCEVVWQTALTEYLVAPLQHFCSILYRAGKQYKTVEDSIKNLWQTWIFPFRWCTVDVY